MDKIDGLITELQATYKLKQTSKTCDYFAGGDVDFFIDKSDVERLRKELTDRGFVVLDRLGVGLYARTFIDDKLYHLDFAAGSYTYWFRDVDFTEQFEADRWSDPDVEKFFRYVLQLRNHKSKYVQFVDTNFDKYGKFLSDTTYLTRPVFRRSFRKQDLLSAMQRSPIALIRLLGIGGTLGFLKNALAYHYRKLGGGEVVAFVGADGAGKTTVLDFMSASNGTHKIYMGDINFKLQRFYNWLHRQPLLLARVSYIFMYIENWCRYGWIWFKKTKGDIVYTDRWPGYNQYLGENTKQAALYKVLYRYFPQPNRFVLLTAPAQDIHNRKPELSTDHIERLQYALRQKLQNKRYREVETTDFDRSLHQTLLYLVHNT